MILTVSFQPENVPFNIQSYRFECDDAMHVHRQLDSSFCFWVFEKRLTQKNCFLFCKKYDLFNSFIFFNNQEIFTVLLPNFHGQRSGGQDLSISYQKQSCFSHGEGPFKEPIHKQFYSK